MVYVFFYDLIMCLTCVGQKIKQRWPNCLCVSQSEMIIIKKLFPTKLYEESFITTTTGLTTSDVGQSALERRLGVWGNKKGYNLGITTKQWKKNK